MGIRNLSSASISTGSKRSKFWDQSTVIYIATYDQIATTVSPTGSTYTFSNIPQIYDHLELRYFGKDNRTPLYSNFNVRVNGDSGSNYFTLNPQVDSRTSGPFGGENTNSTNIASMPWAGNSGDNYWGSGTVKFLDYSNSSRNKTTLFNGGYVGYGDGTSEQGIITQGMGQWRNTAPITSITVASIASSFRADTRFSLYGIKGAA